MTIHQHESSATLLPYLYQCLPSSLPLLCRLENPQRSLSSLILSTFPPSPMGIQPPRIFTAAYIDQSRCRESQAWFYCSLEPVYLRDSQANKDFREVEKQMRDILQYIKLHPPPLPADENPKDWERANNALYIASLHPLLIDAVQAIYSSVDVKLSPVWVKYLFYRPPPSASAQPEEETLPQGLEFGQLRLEDLHRVIATSSISRSLKTMSLLKNTAIFKVSPGRKVPVAWAFVAFDGSLMTWWVEEDWRGRGLGKAVAKKILKVMWENARRNGRDGAYAHADVAVGNWGSRRGLEALGGVNGWGVRWASVDLGGISGSDMNL